MSSIELKVHYYLKRNEKRSDGAVPVLGRITVDRSMVQFSAKVFVNETLWDTQSGRAVGKSRAALAVNRELERINLAIHSHYKELLTRRENITANDVKNAFQGIASVQQTLLVYCTHYDELMSKRVGVNLTLESYKRYGISFNHIRQFLRTKYNLADIAFQALDLSFIESFDFYLRVQRKFKSTTVSNTIAHLKIVVRRAVNEGIITRYPFVGFSIITEPLKPKPITSSELHKLMTTPMDCGNRYLVRDMFLFSIFTGLSFSDIRNLREENIQTAEYGVMWIHTKRQKTGVECHIPLMAIPIKLIEKYRGMGTEGRLFRMLSCSKTNINLKKIALLCGIERNIHFHQGRHSYASLITLSQGVPMETVSRMLGHSDMRATKIYAEVSNEKINSDMRRLEKRIAGKYYLAD